jgi:hypothetical protein
VAPIWDPQDQQPHVITADVIETARATLVIGTATE